MSSGLLILPLELQGKILTHLSCAIIIQVGTTTRKLAYNRELWKLLSKSKYNATKLSKYGIIEFLIMYKMATIELPCQSTIEKDGWLYTITKPLYRDGEYNYYDGYNSMVYVASAMYLLKRYAVNKTACKCILDMVEDGDLNKDIHTIPHYSPMQYLHNRDEIEDYIICKLAACIRDKDLLRDCKNTPSTLDPIILASKEYKQVDSYISKWIEACTMSPLKLTDFVLRIICTLIHDIETTNISSDGKETLLRILCSK